ncbi:hypothetical protein J4401_05175 [Candidatus Woesearchaeota archaeon]|nr:hypothetical protein [Candidatus Woesearchaeota archaeon]
MKENEERKKEILPEKVGIAAEEVPEKYSATLIIGICLGLLVIFSLVQAFEITALKSEVNVLSGIQIASGGAVKIASQPAQKSAPSMVGGC